MNTTEETKFTEFGKSIMGWRTHHGFVTPNSLDVVVGAIILNDRVPIKDAQMATIHGRDLMLGKLMLIVTEVSEADEAQDEDNYREELADTGIRILDVTTALGIDMDGNLAMTTNPLQIDIMGLVNRISAAAECVRKDNVPGVATALAEAFHLLLLWSRCQGYDLMDEMKSKMRTNWQRPIKHGKLCSL